MSVVKPDNALKIFTTVLVLLLSSLACGQIVTTPGTPTPAPYNTDPHIIVTASPTAVPSPTPELIIPAGQTIAQVLAASVVVRQVADGDPTGEYIYAGQSVTILEYNDTGEWVRIAVPAGWVFAGCIDVDSGLGCTAK